jgi:hypothetical protein
MSDSKHGMQFAIHRRHPLIANDATLQRQARAREPPGLGLLVGCGAGRAARPIPRYVHANSTCTHIRHCAINHFPTWRDLYCIRDNITHTVGRNPTDVVARYNHANITGLILLLPSYLLYSLRGQQSFLLAVLRRLSLILVTSLFPRFAVWANWLASWSAITHSYWRKLRRGLP